MPSPLALVLGSLAAASPSTARDFAECDAVVAEEPDESTSWMCFFAVALGSDRIDEALVQLRARLAADPELHLARLYVAKLLALRGDPAAEAEFRAAIDGLSAASRPREEMLARVSLLMMLEQSGRPTEADAELALARALADRSGIPVLATTVDVHQALVWTIRSEELGAARELLLRAIDRLDVAEFRERNLAGMALLALGGIGRETGRLQEAARAYARAAELSARDGLLVNELRARYDGVLLASESPAMKSHRDRAALEPELRAVIELASRAGDRSTEAFARQLLGTWLDGDAAREQFDRCLALAREGAAPEAEGDCLLGLALLEAATDPTEALARVDEAFAIAERHGRPFEAMLALDVRMEVRWRGGDRRAAIAESLVHVAAVEAMRELHGEAQTRARVHAGWTRPFHRLAGELFAGEGPDEVALAFNVLERMRARVLLDALEAGGTPSMGTRRSVEELFAAIDEARASELLVDERFPVPTDVAAQLGPTEAMLSFSIASDVDAQERRGGGSWVVVITRDAGARVIALPDGESLRERIELYAGVFAGDRDPPVAATVRLYDELLATALADLPASIDELVIVPDGPLFALPFAALRSSADAPLLVERYRLNQAPSARLWLHWRAQARPLASRTALVLADPTVDEAADDSTLALARASVGPLPGTRTEAAAIARHVGDGARVLVGADASEAVVRDDSLASYAIVHLAAHTLLDDAHPDRSGIRLAGDDEHDGVLRSAEIVELDLEGRTVVLAACSSATGLALRGEGPMSVARSFFEAGATAVVASLWPLRDDVAAELFDEIYAELARGATLSAAVATAQRTRIARGDPPASWAGLVVLGDGSVAPLAAVRASTARLVAIAGTVLVLAIGLGLAARVARRGRG